MFALRPADRVFVAVDTPAMDGALSLAGSLADLVGVIKLGKAFFTANGPQGVRRIAAGADYLVIGRPITGADDPAQAARAIIDEIEAA